MNNKVLLLLLAISQTQSQVPRPHDKVPRPQGPRPFRKQLYRVGGRRGQGRNSDDQDPSRVNRWLASYRDLIDQWAGQDERPRPFLMSTPARDNQGPVSYIIGHRGVHGVDTGAAQGLRPTMQMEPEFEDEIPLRAESLINPVQSALVAIPTPGQSTTATKDTSFIMSLLGNILPFVMGDKEGHEEDEGDDQDELADDVIDELGEKTSSKARVIPTSRLGLAAVADPYVREVSRHRPKFRPPNYVTDQNRKRRKTTTETSNVVPEKFTMVRSPTVRSPMPVYVKPPDLQNFCKEVIIEISENVEKKKFRKVTMYDKILALISKYKIPVNTNTVNLVVLIDNLCKDDTSLDHQTNKVDAIKDNEIKTDGKMITGLLDMPFLGGFQTYGQKLANSRKDSTQKEIKTQPLFKTSNKVTSLGGNRLPPGFHHNDYMFLPTKIKPEQKIQTPHHAASWVTKSFTENPQKMKYPQVTSYTPRQEEYVSKLHDYNTEIDSPTQLAGPAYSKHHGQNIPVDNVDAGDVDVITLHPNIDINNLDRPVYPYADDSKPTDILVTSKLSFGGASKKPLRKEMVNDFQPSHLVSTTENKIIRGTVHDMPRTTSMFPPTAKTSKLELIENARHPNYLDKIPLSVDFFGKTANHGASTDSPTISFPPTAKTSKMRPGIVQNAGHPSFLNTADRRINAISSPGQMYDREMIKNSPIPSDQRWADNHFGNSAFNPQFATIPDYYPKEAYPYQNFPSPYLSPPRRPYARPNVLRHTTNVPYLSGLPRGSVQRNYETYGPEFNYMPNKMDNVKNIDGYVDSILNQRVDNTEDISYYNHRPKDSFPSHKDSMVTKFPPLTALTLQQLSAGLSTEASIFQTTTPRFPNRNYTLFDMADVVVTHELDIGGFRKHQKSPRLDDSEQNTARSQFVMYYSEPSSPSYPEETYQPSSTYHPDDTYQLSSTYHPKNTYQPPPFKTHADKLSVDFTSDRIKRNITASDLEFLYNITFLTSPDLPEPVKNQQQSHQVDDRQQQQQQRQQHEKNPDVRHGWPPHTVNHRTHAIPDYAKEAIKRDHGENISHPRDTLSHVTEPDEGQSHVTLPPFPLPGFQFINPFPMKASVTFPPNNLPLHSSQLQKDSSEIGKPMFVPAGIKLTGSIDILEPQHGNEKTKDGDGRTVEEVKAVKVSDASEEPDSYYPDPQDNSSKDNKAPVYDTQYSYQYEDMADYNDSTDLPYVIDLTGDELSDILSELNQDDRSSELQQDNALQTGSRSGTGTSYRNESVIHQPGLIDTPSDSEVTDYDDGDRREVMDYHRNDQDEVSEHQEIIKPDNSWEVTEETVLDEVTTQEPYVTSFYPITEFYPASEEKQDVKLTSLKQEIDKVRDNLLVEYETPWNHVNDLAAVVIEDENEEDEFLMNINDPALQNFMSEPSPEMINRAKEEKERTTSNYYETGMNPEKLAYILIGVCCGLSVMCLIIVAVCIGYKSETHYRLEETSNSRRHIRLLKASSSDEDSGSNSSDQDDKSRAKLGNWFTGKHAIQTLDRKSNLAFPTSVYLENLVSGSLKRSDLSRRSSSAASSSSSASASSNNINLFEVGAKKTEDIDDYNDCSISGSSVNSRRSEDGRRSEPVMVLGMSSDDDQVEVHSDQTGIKKKKGFLGSSGGKTKSSYSVSSKFSKATTNLSEMGLREKELARFRFISSEDGRGEESRRSESRASGQENTKDTEEIQWSSNQDRLI